MFAGEPGWVEGDRGDDGGEEGDLVRQGTPPQQVLTHFPLEFP